MKLTDVQIYQVNDSYSKAITVLNHIKQRTLKGDDLAAMKALEEAVSQMELFRMLASSLNSSARDLSRNRPESITSFLKSLIPLPRWSKDGQKPGKRSIRARWWRR